MRREHRCCSDDDEGASFAWCSKGDVSFVCSNGDVVLSCRKKLASTSPCTAASTAASCNTCFRGAVRAAGWGVLTSSAGGGVGSSVRWCASPGGDGRAGCPLVLRHR